MVTQTPPIAPEAPSWFKLWATKFVQLANAAPTSPVRLYAKPTADLPPAADWSGSLMYDQTLDRIVGAYGGAWHAL